MRRLIYENKDSLSAGVTVIVAGWDEVHGGSIYNIALWVELVWKCRLRPEVPGLFSLLACWMRISARTCPWKKHTTWPRKRVRMPCVEMEVPVDVSGWWSFRRRESRGIILREMKSSLDRRWYFNFNNKMKKMWMKDPGSNRNVCLDGWIGSILSWVRWGQSFPNYT